MERPKFVNGYLYHLYNRGVEKRDVFQKEKDYIRFIGDLYEFNDIKPSVLNIGRRLLEVRLLTVRVKPLVEILAFCLMPNHYHLLVRQKEKDGITEFMRKLGTGYTNYFNLRYDRVGPLFQGKFKAVLLEKEAHLTHLPHYIHLNPLDLSLPEWRDQKIKNIKEALRILNKYPWSSLHVYLGKKTLLPLIEPTFLKENVGGPIEFLHAMREWIRDTQFDLIKTAMLE